MTLNLILVAFVFIIGYGWGVATTLALYYKRVSQEPDRPGSNVPKQPTVPPMPKGFKAVDVKRGATIKRPVTGMPLTQDKSDQIKQMARDGKTVKEIAEKVGVSDPTVRKYKAGGGDDVIHESH